MNKIELEILLLSHSVSQVNSYAVILGEKNGKKRLPIVIGAVEAQALAMSLEKMNSPRPLTHDLLKNVMDEFQIELKEVLISNLVEGIFYAQLVCESNGVSYEIDSRTSDALALASRFGCRIFTFDFIMEAAAIEVEQINQPEEESPTEEETEASQSLIKQAGKPANDYSSYSIEELTDMMDAALAKEEYERAARIRDELNKRK